MKRRTFFGRLLAGLASARGIITHVPVPPFNPDHGKFRAGIDTAFAAKTQYHEQTGLYLSGTCSPEMARHVGIYQDKSGHWKVL